MQTLRFLAPAIGLALLAGCTSILTPKIDEQTGTTLAQRCVDYRATAALYESMGDLEHPVYIAAQAFIVANCPALPVAPAAQ